MALAGVREGSMVTGAVGVVAAVAANKSSAAFDPVEPG
jgi:hypothetical protein